MWTEADTILVNTFAQECAKSCKRESGCKYAAYGWEAGPAGESGWFCKLFSDRTGICTADISQWDINWYRTSVGTLPPATFMPPPAGYWIPASPGTCTPANTVRFADAATGEIVPDAVAAAFFTACTKPITDNAGLVLPTSGAGTLAEQSKCDFQNKDHIQAALKAALPNADVEKFYIVTYNGDQTTLVVPHGWVPIPKLDAKYKTVAVDRTPTSLPTGGTDASPTSCAAPNPVNPLILDMCATAGANDPTATQPKYGFAPLGNGDRWTHATPGTDAPNFVLCGLPGSSMAQSASTLATYGVAYL